MLAYYVTAMSRMMEWNHRWLWMKIKHRHTQIWKLCLQFTFHAQLTWKRCFTPVCNNCNLGLLPLRYYFWRNVFEKTTEREIIKGNYANNYFARSDLLITTRKNSHSLIKKLQLALASKNSRSLDQSRSQVYFAVYMRTAQAGWSTCLIDQMHMQWGMCQFTFLYMQ
jgi:hypothetical protein